MNPKTTTGPVGIIPEEYNSIGSVVTEILGDGQTDIILLCFLDKSTFFYQTVKTELKVIGHSHALKKISDMFDWI